MQTSTLKRIKYKIIFTHTAVNNQIPLFFPEIDTILTYKRMKSSRRYSFILLGVLIILIYIIHISTTLCRFRCITSGYKFLCPILIKIKHTIRQKMLRREIIHLQKFYQFLLFLFLGRIFLFFIFCFHLIILFVIFTRIYFFLT